MIRIAALIVMTASLFFATPALARTLPVNCAPRATMTAFLADRYKESPQASGAVNGGGVVEVFESEDGKTWTIVFTRGGISCMKIVGKDWLDKAEPARGQGI